MTAILIELGAAILGLAVLARVASRVGFSAIPLYLLAGLAFGDGGILPLGLSEGFINVGASIGVLLLLFLLGLEYSGEQLRQSLKKGFPSGILDLLLNFLPGWVAGIAMGWNTLPSVLLGGVTWISSSGIVAKLLADARAQGNPETPAILTILVFEDLAMAIYLPLVAVLIRGGSPGTVASSVAIALAAVSLVLFLAIRYGSSISEFVSHESDEVLLLTTLGLVLLVASLAERVHVSSAVGAFLVGVALSGPLGLRSHALLAPLRDLFAATFFFFFGLEIVPASLVPVAVPAMMLGLLTALTKVLTGHCAAGRIGADSEGRRRAGLALIARGEFSIVIAGLGSSLEPALGPFAAAYVLFLAILGPLAARSGK